MKNMIFILLIVPVYFSFGQIFTRVTDESNPIVSTEMTSNYSGAAWIDYNNDGLIDLFSSKSFLFKNQGNGNFELVNTIIGADIAGQSNGVTWSDYDNDGDLDIFMAGRHSSLYENLGNEYFKQILSGQLNEGEDIRGWAASWGDYDRDGYTDLIITHPAGFLGNGPTSNHLFRNNGGLLIRDSTTPVTNDIAPFTIPSFSDYDLDGDLDLFIGSGPAGTAAKDFMYRNNLSQSGTFGFERIDDLQFAKDLQDGQVWNFIDFDNDGDKDAFVTNYSGASNKFYQNNNGNYESISNSLTIGGAKLSNTWGDIDNDGDLDVIITGDSDNDFYINNGDGTFTSVSNDISALTSICATLGDYDDDGDLDLFLSGAETALFENTSANDYNWILINLEGTVSNRSALGANVRIKSTISGKVSWQMREVSAQNTFNGHNSLRVHFGLMDAEIIDTMIINWPGSPAQILENINVNQIVNIKEPISDDFIRVNFKTDSILVFDLPEIQFTDLSTTDPNKPIISWEWDFDNNGIIDAAEQNPIWKYDSLGTYSVRLQISNGVETIERLKKNYLTFIPKPGIPVISTTSHSFVDTTVFKGDRINFSAIAIDTTGYDLSYEWLLNSAVVDHDSIYNYRARTFPFIPRTDTLVLKISNGFNISQNQWLINVEDVTSVVKSDGIPEMYELSQNYPNPFNPSTSISYQLPERSFVQLKIHNILGQEVTTLVKEHQEAGYFNVDFDAGYLSSGIYFYQIKTKNFNSIRKMTLLK